MSYDVRRLKGFLTIAVALLIIALTAVLLVILLFRADKFEIVGTELYDESEILSASGINEGVFLYSVDKENAEQSILEKCTLISKATVVVRMPNKVIISVTEDVPVFYTSVGVSTVMFGYDLRIGEVKQKSAIGKIRPVFNMTNRKGFKTIQFYKSYCTIIKPRRVIGGYNNLFLCNIKNV